MKTNSKLFILFSIIIASSMFTACNKDDDNTPDPVTPVLPKLTIELDHLAGNTKFYLDSTYVTANGDSFTPSLFKYYISNIRLIGINDAEYKVPDSYFLVDQEDAESREIHLSSLPAGVFKSIKFIIGVDSTRNVSGAQTGALDPINGMFWTWNSGYIFLKLEGTSPAITSMGNSFTYHIGGFQGANVNYKEVELSFDGDQLILTNNTNPELHLVTNVLELFTTPTTINLATFSTMVHMPNADANILANNYSNMIKYDHIHAE